MTPRLALLALLVAGAAAAQPQADPPNAVLLVAKPGMLDPNFRETVVLATQSSDASTVGVILNRPGDQYPNLRQILVYPGSFVVERAHTDGIGVAHHARQVLAGESWSEGQVILSWLDTLEGAAIPDDGQNVAIHEFAHQLDQETGAANGAPMLARRAHYKRWSQVLGAEFRLLQRRTALGIDTLFSDYGATDPGEFFAVISEVFFEQPQRMADEHPALYQELALFYGLDPLAWSTPGQLTSPP